MTEGQGKVDILSTYPLLRGMPPSPSDLRNLKHFLPPLRKREGKGGIWDVNKGSLAIVEPGSWEARVGKLKILYLLNYHWRSEGVADSVKMIVFFRKQTNKHPNRQKTKPKQKNSKQLLCFFKGRLQDVLCWIGPRQETQIPNLSFGTKIVLLDSLYSCLPFCILVLDAGFSEFIAE